jgi:hypothetical protein
MILHYRKRLQTDLIMLVLIVGLFHIPFISAAPVIAGLFDEAIENNELPQNLNRIFSDLPDGLNYNLNGFIRSDIYMGKAQTDDEPEVKNEFGEVGLKIRAKKGEQGDGFSEIRIKSGYEKGQEETTVSLREACVNFYPSIWDIRIGHQIIAWGRADGINPTDNVTPKDMSIHSPHEDDRRIANLGLRTVANLMPMRLELVWMPVFRASTFPEFDVPENFELDRGGTPDGRLKNGTGGMKLHLEYPSFDGSLSYVYGYDTYPRIKFLDVSLEGTGDPLIRAQFGYYQHHVIGADFSTTLASMGIRGEAALRLPKHYGAESNEYVPFPDSRYVVGVEREFFQNLNVIVQYVGRYVFDWEELDSSETQLNPMDLEGIARIARSHVEENNRIISGQTHETSHGVMVRIQLGLLHDTLSIEVLGLKNFTTQEWMSCPKIAYELTDAFEVIAGAEIYKGPDNTFYGMIDHQKSAVYLEARVSF